MLQKGLTSYIIIIRKDNVSKVIQNSLQTINKKR